MATQVAVVGFSSLKWGLHAHGLAAVFGGAMLVAAIRPRLSLAGVAGPVAAIVAMLLAVPSQIGGDSMPAWLRLTLVSLVLLSPLPAAVILPRVSPRPGFVGLLIRVALIAGLSMLAAGIAVAIFVMTPAEPAY